MKNAEGETAAAKDLMMTKTTSEIGDDTPDRDTGFLFWGWIVVTALNLVMVSVSLAIFAP